MFRKIGLVLSCLSLPLLAFCDDCKSKDKIYVQLEELFFDADGIWYKNPANQLPEMTQSIHVDSLGYYVSKSGETWNCPKCGHVNQGKPYGWGCAVCSWPYDGHR